MDFIEWLKTGWIFLAAIIGGITLLWGFRKTVKEMHETFTKPINDIKEDNKLLKAAMLSSLKSSLLDACDEYLEGGFASIHEKEVLSDMRKAYNDLGGNNFIDELVDKVNDLPNKKKEIN